MQQLPVSFAGFNAEKMNQSTLLKWNTASEQNNALFEIERSIDGISYQKIGVVKGSGNSSKLVSYTYTDELPQMNDRNYYRLKQLDYDGKYSYSSIEVVDFTNSGTIKDAKSNEFLFNVYPVPSSNVITIDLANTYTGNVNIRIFDNVGKLVETHPATIAKAYSSIEENISHLKAGMYLIEVVSDGGAYKGQAKFIKE
jgi:hypothetical protein